MSDPRRLKDERAGELHEILVRSAERDVPSARAEHRTLAALGLGASALSVPSGVAAAGATAKAGAAVGAVALMKWVGIGVGVGLLTAGAIYEAPKVLHRPALHFVQPGSDVPQAVPPTGRFDPHECPVHWRGPIGGDRRANAGTPQLHAEGAGARAEAAHPLRAVGVRDPRVAPGSTDTSQDVPLRPRVRRSSRVRRTRSISTKRSRRFLTPRDSSPCVIRRERSRPSTTTSAVFHAAILPQRPRCCACRRWKAQANTTPRKAWHAISSHTTRTAPTRRRFGRCSGGRPRRSHLLRMNL